MDNLLGLTAARDRVVSHDCSLRCSLVRGDRAGREVGTLGAVGGYTDGRLSPDGRLSASDSDESGERESYVEPLPRGPKRQVSIGGGSLPGFARSGPEPFSAAPDGTVRSVTRKGSGARLEVGTPRTLFLPPPRHRQPGSARSSSTRRDSSASVSRVGV